MIMDKIIIKAKTRQEIANEYGISTRTFTRWIKKAEIKLTAGLIDPYHLELIYQKFGYPEKLESHKMSEKVRF